jgi:putative transposase
LGRPAKRWPAPVVDRIEEAAAEKAARFSAWGHRKIWKMLRTDGIRVSQTSVKRAMARRQLLMPARFQAERRANAQARKAVFVEPPRRRNRIWQMDFSDFETTAGGNWQICSVIDYVTKLDFVSQAGGTQTARDAVSALEAAMAEAEALLGHPLIQDCTDPQTDEVHPLVIVSDNGPAFKSDGFILFIAKHAELVHVRTRYRAPQTNGVVERFTESLKYEHLYRLDIATGHDLAEECEAYRRLYNDVRPHEGLDFLTPREAYLAEPEGPPTPVRNFRRSNMGGLVKVAAVQPEPELVSSRP